MNSAGTSLSLQAGSHSGAHSKGDGSGGWGSGGWGEFGPNPSVPLQISGGP